MMKSLANIFLVLLIAGGGTANAQFPIDPQRSGQQTQVSEYWIDQDTGLMWAAKDSGKDLSWNNAITNCRNLRLAGYSNWRLADMFELQGIYDSSANSPGLTGMHSEEPTTWHVKGNLFLTAYEWAGPSEKGAHKHHFGYAYYFDFNEGKSNNDPTGWPYPFQFRRALCVRGSGDPLGAQRRH